MKVQVGIDASSSCTGLGILDENNNLIHYAKIKPSKNNDFRDNACQIIEKIMLILQDYEIEKIYMEDVPEFAKQGSRGKNILKTLAVLGAVQGVFYQKLVYECGYDLAFVGVHEWRKKLDFLKGERDRESLKEKAVNFVNEKFQISLNFAKGRKVVANDDDIAEAIALVYAMKTK